MFNDERCNGIKLGADGLCAVVFDILRLTRARVLPLPVHAVSADGFQGLHVSQGRLNLAMASTNDAASKQGSGSSSFCSDVCTDASIYCHLAVTASIIELKTGA